MCVRVYHKSHQNYMQVSLHNQQCHGLFGKKISKAKFKSNNVINGAHFSPPSNTTDLSEITHLMVRPNMSANKAISLSPSLEINIDSKFYSQIYNTTSW